MRIVNSKPPNYEEICAVFNVRNRPGVVFTYADTVYCPGMKPGEALPNHLVVHEGVHVMQQASYGPKQWWQRYLADAGFRLEQEVEAYWAQVQSMNRRERRANLERIISDLSGPMYGNMVNRKKARELLLGPQGDSKELPYMESEEGAV